MWFRLLCSHNSSFEDELVMMEDMEFGEAVIDMELEEESGVDSSSAVRWQRKATKAIDTSEDFGMSRNPQFLSE